MAYRFGAGGTDKIRTGTGIVLASTWSISARLTIAAANATDRVIAAVAPPAGSATCQFYFSSSGTNVLRLFMTTGGGTAFPLVDWTSGFTAGSHHVVVGTYDGSNLRLYADVDATAKATQAASGPPDQDAGTFVTLGNDSGATTASLDGILYEVGWWPGVVLTGAQSALLGDRGRPYGTEVTGVPTPTEYWGLITDANADIGGHHGTVTGAVRVGHGWFPGP
jgi:hypothetical protein